MGRIVVGVFILWLFLVYSLSAHAKREFFVGGFTYHMTDKDNVASRYEHKASNDGRLISNPMLGVALTTDYEGGLYSGHTFFIGQNSIGREMGGYLYDEGGHLANGFSFGLVAGAYAQQRLPFLDAGINPFSIGRINSDIDVVPVAGTSFGLKISTGVKAHLLVTPVISNLSFSFEF